MIFLGAGASKELGIKTMQELTKDVVAKLEQRGYSNETAEIISSLKEFGIKPDFEAIYSVLEGLGNIRLGVKEAGPLTAYVCKKLSDIKSIPDSEQILKELRTLIFEECSKIDRNKLEQVFDPLFQARAREGHVGPGYEPFWISVASRIVTTNYDMAVELYHWKKELPLSDGFHPGINPSIHTYRPGSISKGNNVDYGRRKGKTLIKLHGASWYFKQGSRIIKTTIDPKSKDILTDSEIGEQIMIYPTKEKPILRKPHYDFFKTFKELIWNFLIVIGYSFRDEPVNTILSEQLQSATKSIVFMVNPHAEEIVRNFPGYKKFAPRFHNINIEFGKKGYESEFFSTMKRHLHSSAH